MDYAVQTGTTKAGDGTSLATLSFSSKEKEQVLLLLQVKADPQAAKTLEEECAGVLKHSLLETEGESWHRLDGTLKEINGLLKGLLVSQTVEEVHAVIALMDSDGVLHVSSAGRGEAYLVRDGQASQITEFSRGKPVTGFINISSGPMEDGDAVVFSTQRLLRTLTPAQLAQETAEREEAIDGIKGALEDERETAAIGVLFAGNPAPRLSETPSPKAGLVSRRAGRKPSRQALLVSVRAFAATVPPFLLSAGRSGWEKLSHSSGFLQSMRERFDQFLADLKHPERKRRAHLLLLASAVAAFLVIFLVVKLTVTSQQSKTRAELSALVDKVNAELLTADNRRIAGDTDGANQVLQQADAWAKQVMDNESGLFRVEALDLLDRIRSKSEEINNIVRVNPRVVVNLSDKNSKVSAQGLIGIADGEFIAYDTTNTYHVLLNSVDDPKKLTEDGFIIRGDDFPRYKSQVFLTTGNTVMELQGNQPVAMKTDDPAGWVAGKDIKTYLRNLYILSDKQILKYQRQSDRYGAAVQYNINGDLTGAQSFTIDSSIFVLKQGGSVLKLMRGETQPFAIRHLPPDALKNATKIFKVSSSNMYFLDPSQNRVVVATDGGATGESSYLKQYVLEGEQIGKLQDLYVDPQESHLYVVDEKRVYIVDLVK